MTLLKKLAPRNRYIIFGAFGALVILSLGLHFFFKAETDSKKDYRATKVEVEEVRIGSMTRTITAVGTLRASQTVLVRPEVSGLIAKAHVDGGEYVSEDDPLFTLDDKLPKAELKEAEAKLSLARVSHDRATRLEAKKFGSTANRDKTLAELRVAEALVESAKSKLSRTVIKAPFDGIVGLHSISIGAPVDPNKELITLVDITPMKVDFKIPAKFLRYMSTGQRVKVSVDGFQEVKFPGLVEGIDAKVDPSAHSIEARALIPNKQRILKPGLFARVDIVVGAKSKALILPATSVDKQGDQDFVYKVVEGRAFQTPVVTGIQEGDNVEILRGINPGDHVVTVGQLKIQDGNPVRYELDGKIYTHDQEAEDKKIAEIKAQKEKEKKEQETLTAEAQESSEESEQPLAESKSDAKGIAEETTAAKEDATEASEKKAPEMTAEGKGEAAPSETQGKLTFEGDSQKSAPKEESSSETEKAPENKKA